MPQNWFALYKLLASENDYANAKDAMSLGVHELGNSEGDSDEEGDDEGNEGSDEEGGVPTLAAPQEIYRAVRPETVDLNDVIAQHPSYTRENHLSPDSFAAIDERFGSEGPVLVCVGEETDSFRCKGPAAGEILRWIYVGFMSWEEAKGFAERQE